MNKSNFIADDAEILRIKKNVLIPLQCIKIAFRLNITLLFGSAYLSTATAAAAAAPIIIIHDLFHCNENSKKKKKKC